MPKKISVIKRIAISERNRNRNKIYKSTIKTLSKKYLKAIKNNAINEDNDQVLLLLADVYRMIDKSIKRGIFHKNTGSRKKSVLAKLLKTN